MSGDNLWDEQAILSEFDGDEDILLETCSMFLDLYQEHLQALWAKHASEDYKGAGDEAHSIKGMVGYFNKGRVMDAARLIEDKAKKGEYSSGDELKKDIDNLSSMLEQLVLHIREFTGRYKAA